MKSGSVCVFRADADPRTGIGHVMRCLTLAEAWREEGGEAVFLGSWQSEALRGRVAAAGISFIPIAAPHPDVQDLQTTLPACREFFPPSAAPRGWVVVDGYHFDPQYQLAMRGLGVRLMVIDDTGRWPQYHADLLLNQNVTAERVAYVFDSKTLTLRGTRYALLRRQFHRWRGWARQIPAFAKRVLLTMEGGTLRTSQCGQFRRWEVETTSR